MLPHSVCIVFDTTEGILHDQPEHQVPDSNVQSTHKMILSHVMDSDY